MPAAKVRIAPFVFVVAAGVEVAFVVGDERRVLVLVTTIVAVVVGVGLAVVAMVVVAVNVTAGGAVSVGAEVTVTFEDVSAVDALAASLV